MGKTYRKGDKNTEKYAKLKGKGSKKGSKKNKPNPDAGFDPKDFIGYSE